MPAHIYTTGVVSDVAHWLSHDGRQRICSTAHRLAKLAVSASTIGGERPRHSPLYRSPCNSLFRIRQAFAPKDETRHSRMNKQGLRSYDTDTCHRRRSMSRQAGGKAGTKELASQGSCCWPVYGVVTARTRAGTSNSSSRSSARGVLTSRLGEIWKTAPLARWGGVF